MRSLSSEDLKQRFADLLGVQLELTSAGQIGFETNDELVEIWFPRLTHVMEEMTIRHGLYPRGYEGTREKVQITDPQHPLAATATKVVSDEREIESYYWFKYGKRKYVDAALRRGEFRIASASSYKDPSLNPTIQDDEIEISIHIPVENVDPDMIQTESHATLTQRANSDYYVFCMAGVLVPRLFVDFEYDACLIITKPTDFATRLKVAAEEHLRDWQFYVSEVSYIDPFFPLKELNVFNCKHFRYAYQKEIRGYWIPPTPKMKLEPLFLELGSLEDCSRMLVLSDL